jgi:hypothetical protein
LIVTNRNCLEQLTYICFFLFDFHFLVEPKYFWLFDVDSFLVTVGVPKQGCFWYPKMGSEKEQNRGDKDQSQTVRV